MISICALLHDMGKYSNNFQDYIKEAINQTKLGNYENWKNSTKKIDHGVYGAKYIWDKFKNQGAFESLTCEIIAEVICYHHGGLPNTIEDFTSPMLNRFEKVDKESFQEVVRIFESENNDFNLALTFKLAVQEVKNIFSKFENIKFEIGLFIKTIYSILVDADRLDSYIFEVGEEYIKKDFCQWEKYIENLDLKLEEYKNIDKSNFSKLEKSVSKVREEISDLCYKKHQCETGIYTLTVPTGGGKTLSSLRFALNHLEYTGKKRIIYVVPYITILEQNAIEIRKILGADNILEYHSSVMDFNKNEDFEIASQRFDSPIIFTTMVQFLNSIYANGNHNLRRFHNLTDSVIIFDEVQSLPIKCLSLFYSVISYLKNVGGTTSILCTATQPNLSYIKEKLVLNFGGEIVENSEMYFDKLARVNVIDKTEKSITYQQLAEFVKEIKVKNSSVLVVLNTIKSVEKLYSEIDKSIGKVYILTTHLCASHRKEVIEQLKQDLKLKKSIVCISTQLIEAGVDVSFDTAIRSLAGLDSIAQSMGRVNRHGEKDISNGYIVKIDEENVSSLIEIKNGQNCTSIPLCSYKKSPQQYNNSLLHPKLMDDYFKKYYMINNINSMMKYPTKHGEIYNLLELSKVRISTYKGNETINLSQMFKTARENFEVIPDVCETVIVPYGKGKEYINVLLSDCDVRQKYDILKQLQQYSVNISKYMFNKLKEDNGLISSNIDGLNILSELYYNNEKGVSLEKTIEFIDF